MTLERHGTTQSPLWEPVGRTWWNLSVNARCHYWYDRSNSTSDRKAESYDVNSALLSPPNVERFDAFPSRRSYTRGTKPGSGGSENQERWGEWGGLSRAAYIRVDTTRVRDALLARRIANEDSSDALERGAEAPRWYSGRTKPDIGFSRTARRVQR